MVEVPLREAQGNRKVLSASSFLVMKLTNMFLTKIILKFSK